MAGLLLDILFSPLIFVIIGYVLYQDIQKAVLLALFIITAIQLIKLVMRVFMLGLNALTLNIFGFVRNSLRIFSALVFIAIYWFIYILIFGSNFSL
ncbi:MAG: hypothetical protein TR69_WS6001000196 [candidate division WS6 bacterium OLB20]|uniref:Uncharacterized protein n=1 Tax=candidate division WS6 bacterium OLB20 TaxID=1617426 RepID=A0A136M095_9BACT|nr:MAG: hypothetical protein TR69_WS6001000196 [candidate division WS6 bacterium OLB20]